MTGSGGYLKLRLKAGGFIKSILSKLLGLSFLILIGFGMFSLLIGCNDVKKSPTTARTKIEGITSAQEEAVYDYNTEVVGTGRFQGKFSSKIGMAIVNIAEKKQLNGFQANGKFVVLRLVVTNCQDDAVTFNSLLVKLIDSSGIEYSASSEESTAMAMSSKKELFLKKIYPLKTITGYIVFDVPPNVMIEDMKLKFRGGIKGDVAELPLILLKTK